MRQLLGDRAEPFCQRYGVLENGNAPFDPQNEFTGKNLLYTARSLEDVAERGRSVPVLRASWRRRARCSSPLGSAAAAHLDDKVLTAWNGLMIGAGARAGRILGDPSWVADAERAAGFCARDCGTLVQDAAARYRRQHAAVAAYAEDYAYLASGLLELFQALAIRPGSSGRSLHGRLDEQFADPVEAAGSAPPARIRRCCCASRSSTTARAGGDFGGRADLLALAHLTGDSAMMTRAEAAIGSFRAQLGRSVPLMLRRCRHIMQAALWW